MTKSCAFICVCNVWISVCVSLLSSCIKLSVGDRLRSGQTMLCWTCYFIKHLVLVTLGATYAVDCTCHRALPAPPRDCNRNLAASFSATFL